MKKYSNKIIVFSLLLVISITTLTSNIVYICNHGVNYTQEYNMYKELKDITSTELLTETVTDMQINYHIKNQKMTFDDYSSFYFSLNDNTCTIKGETEMSIFEKIDQGTDKDLEIKTSFNENTTKTHIEYNTLFDTYSKIEKSYFYFNDGIYISVFFQIILIIFWILSIMAAISRYKELKKKEADEQKRITEKQNNFWRNHNGLNDL